MPELRKDPVTGRWVIIATERAMRPTDFIREHVVVQGGRLCPFCPGQEQKTPPEILAYRDSGGPNEPGWRVRVVPNKFPALRVEGELNRQGEGLYDKMNGVGAHEVIIETPDHQRTFGDLTEKQVEEVLWAFRDRILDLRKDIRLRYILIFKNHGEAAGASLEHTHSQLIALPVVPKRVQEEIEGARKYYEFKERCIFCDIVRQEMESGPRVILESDHHLALSPYAARFPFETWIVPKRHHSHFEAAEAPAIQNLAWVLRVVIRKMDKVLERPAYNLMLHTAPVQEGAMTHYHWHLELIPRLTRVAGFEWGAGFYINPTPPEIAASFLREAGLV
ncbi:MAG: galactose-1-phosphate uridylyltransferase [Bryobacterales bacterium]|nr:galactose-1-phosphate uridylyltransferase [Bryobacteraceae bacterium]MDW8353091.1 galactose-1-phosphate uridylyltransferase [Bryobacterales bacterium]